MTTTHDVTNDTHRASCAECTALWAELDAISAEAAKLPTLTPSRDLWSGIEARLGAQTTAARPSRWMGSQGFRLALAASLLVAVSSGITWQLATSSAPLDSAATAPTTTAPTAEPSAQLVAFEETVSDMDREIAGLEQVLSERRSLLDPRTVEVLETNIKLIDEAIAESRRALEADPASHYLATQYTRAYTSKLTLLRDAATLPTGI